MVHRRTSLGAIHKQEDVTRASSSSTVCGDARLPLLLAVDIRTSRGFTIFLLYHIIEVKGSLATDSATRDDDDDDEYE
jgi:hypothetical protein